MWKTLSARIRGAKTELEELGEEEDEFTETTSKLQGLVKSLTGFDILEEDGKTFKSIYDIILGIGKEWKNLSDIEQASLGEALAGKRNANALFAVLNNIETLENAYATAEDSAGSAQKEQENYAKSIQYSLDVLKASAQEFWTTLINSGAAKKVIDFLTRLLNAITDITKATDGLPIFAGAGLAAIFGNFPNVTIKNIKKLVNTLGLFGKEVDLSTITLDKFLELLKEGGKVDSAEGIIKLPGLLMKIPGPAKVAAVAIAALTAAVVATKIANDNLRKSAQNLAQEYSNAKSSLGDYKKQISDLYDVINDENVSYEDSKKARENLLEIQDQLIDKYGKEYESINLITDAVNGQVDALDRLTEKQWTEAMNQFNEQNLPGWDWMNRLVHGASDNIGVMLKDMENYSVSLRFNDPELTKLVQSLYGGNLFSDSGNIVGVGLSGSLDDIYDKILSIQQLARDNGASDGVLANLSKQANKTKELLDQYGEFYNQYVLNTRIASNEAYSNVYGKILDEYQVYREKIVEGNEAGAKESKDKIIQQYQELYDSLMSDGELSTEELSVYKVMSRLVPELQEELDKNVLRVHLQLDDDDVKKERDEIRDAILKFGSEEELLNYKLSESKDGPLDTFYLRIKEYAEAHQIDIQTLIDLYRELYGLEGLSARNSAAMIEKFMGGKKISPQLEAVYADAINSLSEDAYQTALLFSDKQWEEVRKEMNAIRDSTEENIGATELYQQAVEKVVKEWKKAHGEVEEISDATILDSVEGINTRLKSQFDELGELYKSIFHGDKGFTLSDITNEQLEGLKKAFIDLEDERGNKIGASFKGGEEALNSFIDTITSAETKSKSLADQQKIVQQAFNDLATAYFYSADGLKELNEQTKDALSQQFKQMGIVNADEVINSRLQMQELVDSFVDFDETLEREYDKLYDWGLGDYASQIENKTVQTVFGNVDMDKRAIINWSSELEKTYQKELASWDYNPEYGGIDTVFGGADNFFSGDKEVQVAFTPILETDKNAELLGKKTVENYIQNIIDQATDESGKLDIQKALEIDKRGFNTAVYDEYGRTMGQKFVHGLIAAIGDDAIDISKLMHFSGLSGAIQLAEKDIADLQAVEEELAAQGRTLADVTQEDIDGWVKAGQVSEAAAAQLQLYAYAKALSNGTFMDESASVQSLMQLCRVANLGVELISELNALEGLSSRASNAYAHSQYEYGDALMAEYRQRLLQAESKMQQAWNEKIEMPEIDFGPVVEGAGKGGSDSADAYVEAYEKEKKELENQRDMGLISEKEYLDKLKALIDKFFKDRAEYAEKYMDEMKDYMSSLMSYFNSVISGVTTLLDHRISKLQKTKDATITALQEEQEAAEAAIQAQIDGIQEEIDALDDLIDAKNDEIDKLNDQIDAINEANAARDRSINLQKAEYELQRQMNQRTKLVYTGGAGGNQMRYERDEAGVRDARENLKDAQDDIAIAAIEKQIKLIEDEIEAIEKQKKALEEQQEELQKALEATSKYYEKLIKEQEKMFDEMLEKLEETKSKWEELAEVEEISKAWGLVSDAMGEFGYTVDDVLNDVPGAFEAFKGEYVKILEQMHSGDEGYLNGLKNTVGQIPGEYQKVADAANNTKQPLADLGNTSEAASGGIKSLGGAASTTAGQVGELKTETDGAVTNVQNLANVQLGDLMTNLTQIASDVEKISGTDLSDIVEKLNSMDTTVDDGFVIRFTDLADAIIAIGQVILSTLATDLERMKVATDETTVSNIQQIQAALDLIQQVNISQLVTDFTTLKDLSTPLLEALNGVDEGGGLITALQTLQGITLDDNITAQFNNLEDAVNNVSNAINGSGASGETTGGTGKDATGIPGEKTGGGEAEGSGVGLAGAIEAVKQATTDNIGTSAEDTGDTAIGHFNALGQAIEAVTTEKIGMATEDGGEPDPTTMVGALGVLAITADEEIPKVISLFDALKEAINSCVNEVAELVGKIENIPTLGGVAFTSMPQFTYTGTANTPHFQGTAKYTGDWSVGKNEKSMVGELGPEIVLRNGKYSVVGKDGPEIVSLKKDDIVLNHLQSAQVLSKHNQISGGPSHAGGTVPFSFAPFNFNESYSSLMAKLKEVDMPTMSGIKTAISEMSNGIKAELQNITRSNVINTTVHQSNTFNVSGVTGEEVAQKINSTLVQTFSGMSLNAYQRSMA